MVYREVVAHVAVAHEGHWASRSPLRGPFLRSRVPTLLLPKLAFPKHISARASPPIRFLSSNSSLAGQQGSLLRRANPVLGWSEKGWFNEFSLSVTF